MLPINWLNHSEVPAVNVKILENFYNTYCTSKYVCVEKYFESWDTKIHGPRNYLQIFYVDALIDKCGTPKYYPLAMYQNGICKETRSSVTGNTDNGIPSSSTDSATTSKRKKYRRDTFKLQMKKHCLYLKAQDDELFRNR